MGFIGQNLHVKTQPGKSAKNPKEKAITNSIQTKENFKKVFIMSVNITT